MVPAVCWISNICDELSVSQSFVWILCHLIYVRQVILNSQSQYHKPLIGVYTTDKEKLRFSIFHKTNCSTAFFADALRIIIIALKKLPKNVSPHFMHEKYAADVPAFHGLCHSRPIRRNFGSKKCTKNQRWAETSPQLQAKSASRKNLNILRNAHTRPQAQPQQS